MGYQSPPFGIERVGAGEIFIGAHYTQEGLIKGCTPICRDVIDEGTAEFMVRACNSHDELLAESGRMGYAAFCIRNAIEDNRPYEHLLDELFKHERDVAAVIAKAKGS